MIQSVPPRKRALIMGGSGFIGKVLGEILVKENFQVKILSRDRSRYENALPFPCEIVEWDGQTLPGECLESVDVVINLVGQGIADQRWSDAYKREILKSRVNAVTALKKALEHSEKKPELIIQSSAIGIYHGGSEQNKKNEESKSGQGFLAEVCKKWEEAAKPIEQHSRLVTLRLGLVLGWTGGAFSKLWDLYSIGLGASLGHGKQNMNWVHVEDVCLAIVAMIRDTTYQGVYNIVAPKNCSNQEFHERLAEHTVSLSLLKAPSLAIKAIMGERSCLILDDIDVEPKRLCEAGFVFKHETFNHALMSLLSERHNPRFQYLTLKQWLPVDEETVWKFVSSAENLEKITPKWLKFRIVKCSTQNIEHDSLIDYELKLHGIPITWRSKINSWIPGDQFSDMQLKGPYKLWYHRHIFTKLAGGTMIEDRIEYGLPLFPFSNIAIPFVKSDLNKIFRYRQEAMATHLLGESSARESTQSSLD